MRIPLTRLRPHPSSVGAARRFVADVLLTRDFNVGCIESAVLLTSEIVTDAIVRAAGDFELSVVPEHPMVRIEVRCPQTSPAERADAASSYRLRIVEALSEESGVEEVGGGGRSAWFEIRS
jgi:hypothetical protein